MIDYKVWWIKKWQINSLSQHLRDLDIQISIPLSFDKHYKSTCNKSYQSLNMITAADSMCLSLDDVIHQRSQHTSVFDTGVRSGQYTLSAQFTYRPMRSNIKGASMLPYRACICTVVQYHRSALPYMFTLCKHIYILLINLFIYSIIIFFIQL